MPTYEYKCQKCSNEFEEFQSITAEAKAKCPKCGGKAKRMISLNSGIIFKGKGFYVTDTKITGHSISVTKTDTVNGTRSVLRRIYGV